MPDNSGSSGIKNDPEVIRNQSKLTGYSTTLRNGQPAHIGITTAGDASISFISFGAEINAGGTSGDDARLIFDDRGNNTGFDKIVRDIIIQPESSPYSNNMAVGFADRISNSADTAYLDLKNGQVVSGSSSQSITQPPAFEFLRVKITRDFSNSETTFELSGSVNDTITFQNVQSETHTVAFSKSSGNFGDILNVIYFSEVYFI